MGVFDLFGKQAKEPPAPRYEKKRPETESAAYSGMRVEVTTDEGQLLFVAKILNLSGAQAELHQYSESEIPLDSRPLHVRIRGYNDHSRKAVHMEGVIVPVSTHVWQVKALAVQKVGNERAFFRLDTNLDAAVTMFSGLSIGEKPCKMLNISVGGAYISSMCKYHEGEKFLLKVRLLEDKPESIMFSQIMRVIEKEDGRYEYGCQFLELTEDDQERITQNIYAAQRQKRSAGHST